MVFCTTKCKFKAESQKERTQRALAGNPVKSHGGNHTGKTGAEHYANRTGIGLFHMRLSKRHRARVRFCERCSKDLSEALRGFWCVHHRDHDRNNNHPSNFEFLCKRCHQIEHRCWQSLTKSRRKHYTKQGELFDGLLAVPQAALEPRLGEEICRSFGGNQPQPLQYAPALS